MLAKNMGQTDRTIRAIVGVVLLVLAFAVLGGGLAWLAGIVGVVMLATAALAPARLTRCWVLIHAA